MKSSAVLRLETGEKKLKVRKRNCVTNSKTVISDKGGAAICNDSKERETNEKEETRGMVLRIERSSIHDGDGFRTVVFLKGCPLRCQWCSTPESQSFQNEHTADSTYGRVMTVEEVMKEVRKDTAFFFHSGGGVTLSGGEILAQPDFTLALLQASWRECINTAIETSFFAPWAVIRSILPYVNTAFVDIKIFNREQHKKYCGVDNQTILENLLQTNSLEKPFRLIVRVPIIPGINDTEEELEPIGRFCSELRYFHHVQLLPYHRLGTDTYKKLGRPYLLADVTPPSPERMLRCREIIHQYVKQVL